MAANDYDTLGRTVRPYKGGTAPPAVREGSLSHYATGVYELDSETGKKVLVDVKDEEIRKTHRAMMRGRSRNAHAHSGKPHHFTHTQGTHDSTMEIPYLAGQIASPHSFDRQGRKVRRLRAR
jgi:hypothetical protein